MSSTRCWCETTISRTPTGLPFSYCTVTWLLESGPSTFSLPEWRGSRVRPQNFWGEKKGARVITGVSFLGEPETKPPAPAPPSLFLPGVQGCSALAVSAGVVGGGG